MKRQAIGLAWLTAALFALAVPIDAAAQSSSRILEYNEKGEVTGVVETDPKSKGTAATNSGKHGPAGQTPDAPTPIPGEESAEPGELIIVDPPSGFLRTMQGEGYTLIERITLATLGMTVIRLRTPPNLDAISAVQAITTRYPSLAVGVNQRFTLNNGPKGDYGRDVVGWGEVPAVCGSGIRIGMVDTIVDVGHPAIKGQRIARRSFLPKGAKSGVSDHGTAVAALLIGHTDAGEWKGLLPGASLYAANIFSAREDGGLRANLASMMRALEWLASKKVQVVNFSLAGSSNRILTKLMEKASSRGMALVAAAGNGGPTAKPAYPAALPDVLAVTAVDKGLEPYAYANQGDYIDFAAPGVRLWTARSKGGGLQSGTSFAAPFITAAVALHLSTGVEADPRLLRKELLRFTKDLGAPGRDAIFGWGLVRIRPNC